MVQDLIKEAPGKSETSKLSRVTTEPRTANHALGQVILFPLLKSHTNETFAPGSPLEGIPAATQW
jgi:hypothetical protein